MEKIAIEDVENRPIASDIERMLTEPLGLSEMALNYFELEPGESFAGAMHTHTNQEEVFYILEGAATFRTVDEQIRIGTDEVVRFAPGEYQEGRNESDGLVRALAFGAPREAGETRVRVPCDACGDSDYRVADTYDGGATLTCPNCDDTIELDVPGAVAEDR